MVCIYDAVATLTGNIPHDLQADFVPRWCQADPAHSILVLREFLVWWEEFLLRLLILLPFILVPWKTHGKLRDSADRRWCYFEAQSSEFDCGQDVGFWLQAPQELFCHILVVSLQLFTERHPLCLCKDVNHCLVFSHYGYVSGLSSDEPPRHDELVVWTTGDEYEQNAV